MSDVVIFGAGKIAEEAFTYLTNDSPHDVVAFTVDGEYVNGKEKLGRPLLAFEEVENQYPPGDYSMFVAVGYQNLNKLRARKCEEAQAKGYELVSYISSRAANIGEVAIGYNCLILEFAVIQPWSRVGNDVFIWSANHVGHHASVGDHCYIAGNAVISGNTVVGPYCFVGVGANIGHEIEIGAESFLGAGTLVTKSVEPRSVYIAPDTPKFRLDSPSFMRLTKMQ